MKKIQQSILKVVLMGILIFIKKMKKVECGGQISQMLQENICLALIGKGYIIFFLDYPHNLTKEEKEIFDEDEPYWREFLKNR